MSAKREEVLNAFVLALTLESVRHKETVKKAKETCLEALKAERKGRKNQEVKNETAS